MPALLLIALLVPYYSFANDLVVIDPGHTNDAPGVVGSCNSQEVWVNDQLALVLADELTRAGFKVRFSKIPNTDKTKIRTGDGRESNESRAARADFANKQGAKLFISLHHDAAPDSALIQDSAACPEQPGLVGRVISPDFLDAHSVGFNVFVHNQAGDKFKRSLRFAQSLGRNLIAAGQAPSDYHVKEIESDCGSCRFEDKELGVMSRNLAVLRRTQMPSVLIEIANLLIPESEKKANDPAFQKLMAEAIRQAVETYFAKGAR